MAVLPLATVVDAGVIAMLVRVTGVGVGVVFPPLPPPPQPVNRVIKKVAIALNIIFFMFFLGYCTYQ